MRLLVKMKSLSLSTDCLEETCNTTSRAPKYKQHLSLLDQAIKVSKDTDLALTVVDPLFDHEGALKQDVEDILLIVRIGSITVDREASECNACRMSRISGRVFLRMLEQSLCPLLRIELVRPGRV